MPLLHISCSMPTVNYGNRSAYVRVKSEERWAILSLRMARYLRVCVCMHAV